MQPFGHLLFISFNTAAVSFISWPYLYFLFKLLLLQRRGRALLRRRKKRNRRVAFLHAPLLLLTAAAPPLSQSHLCSHHGGNRDRSWRQRRRRFSLAVRQQQERRRHNVFTAHSNLGLRGRGGIQSRSRNFLTSRIRIPSRIRNKSFRIHNPACL